MSLIGDVLSGGLNQQQLPQQGMYSSLQNSYRQFAGLQSSGVLIPLFSPPKTNLDWLNEQLDSIRVRL